MIVTSEGDYSTMMVCTEYHYMSVYMHVHVHVYMYMCTCAAHFFMDSVTHPEVKHSWDSKTLFFNSPHFHSLIPMRIVYYTDILPIPCSWFLYLPIPIPLSWPVPSHSHSPVPGTCTFHSLFLVPVPSHSHSPGWMYILEKHGGRLPLRIKAVPEGTVVPYKNGESVWGVSQSSVC